MTELIFISFYILLQILSDMTLYCLYFSIAGLLNSSFFAPQNMSHCRLNSCYAALSPHMSSLPSCSVYNLATPTSMITRPSWMPCRLCCKTISGKIISHTVGTRKESGSSKLPTTALFTDLYRNIVCHPAGNVPRVGRSMQVSVTWYILYTVIEV